jgi:hypothetical protein
MKTTKCHIYDLENSLATIERKIWIIDKNNPSEPVIRISESDYKLIESGVFRSQNNRVMFNGKEYFLSKEMISRLGKMAQKKSFTLENLGISFREYLDKELIDKLKFEILSENISHLRNKHEDFYIISSRLIEDKYTKLTNELRDELTNEGIKLEKIYFINETFYNQDEDETSYKKAVILLQHLFGLKIKDHKFVAEATDRYNEVCYYDASESNISDLKNINTIFEKVYSNTENESLKDVVKTLLEKLDLKVCLNLVTTNEMNRFNTTEIDVHLMVKESFVKSFKQFKK